MSNDEQPKKRWVIPIFPVKRVAIPYEVLSEKTGGYLELYNPRVAGGFSFVDKAEYYEDCDPEITGGFTGVIMNEGKNE